MVRNNHDDLVVLTTSLDHKLVHRCLILTTNRAVVTILEVLLQSVTEHQGVLTDVELDLVTSVLGGTEVSEGSGGHVVV